MTPKKWSGPFNLTDTRSITGLSNKSWIEKRLREKRWCYMGVFTADMIFGCAVIHLGYIGSAFVFCFDRGQKQLIEHTFVFPPIGRIRYDRHPENGTYYYKSFLGHIRMSAPLSESGAGLSAVLRIPGRQLRAQFQLPLDKQFEPMHFAMPMPGRRSAFTTKAAGLPVKGSVRVRGKKISVDSESAFAVYDWTNGFYPRKTFWNWACGAGIDDSGNRIGFNFSVGVYESGQLENTVWINGKPHQTGPVRFIYDSKNTQKNWQIQTLDDMVRMDFTPEGQRKADDNFGIVKSRFIQALGSFSGRFQISFQTHSFKNITGVTEEHFAKW